MSRMKDAPFLYRLLHAVLPPLLNRYFRIEVEGLENVPGSGGAILACNHLSFVDSLLLPLNLSRPVYFLGKAEYFESGKSRWFFRGVGVIPTYREGGDRAREALESGIDVLRRGDLLGIYPEGTRSPDGRLYRGHTGPARMAIETEVPIVPCAMIGTRETQPPGKLVPRRSLVKVRYGRPLDFSRYAGQQEDAFVLRSATDELMYEIMRLSGQNYVDEYALNIKQGKVALEETDRDHAPSVDEVPAHPDEQRPGDGRPGDGPGEDRRAS